ncbi:MAG: OmpA/MotB family protein [Planctomycetota bacterium]|jgi:chemotaxis protein MotB
MAKKKQKEESAPLWMVTMSDMNTLMMTFFIILFSMMVEDKRLYLYLRDLFKDLSNWASPAEPGDIEKSPHLNIVLEEEIESGTEVELSATEIPRPRHLNFRITKRPNRVVIHLQGKKFSFAVGDYRLTADQKEVVDWVKEFMRGYRQNVIVRGFTDDANPLDAYVLEGSRMRPAQQGDRTADHFLLASLRAQEVRRYLTRGGVAVDERQVRVGEERPDKPLVRAFNLEDNRRVEIVISSSLSVSSQ